MIISRKKLYNISIVEVSQDPDSFPTQGGLDQEPAGTLIVYRNAGTPQNNKFFIYEGGGSYRNISANANARYWVTNNLFGDATANPNAVDMSSLGTGLLKIGTFGNPSIGLNNIDYVDPIAASVTNLVATSNVPDVAGVYKDMYIFTVGASPISITLDATRMPIGRPTSVVIKQAATPQTINVGASGATLKWGAGDTYVASNTANAIDIITAVYDGTNIYANYRKAYA